MKNIVYVNGDSFTEGVDLADLEFIPFAKTYSFDEIPKDILINN